MLIIPLGMPIILLPRRFLGLRTDIRMELLKMLFKAAEFDADPVMIGDPYDDVSNLDWFAAYVNSAKELNITPVEGSEFEPDADMNRGEVAETIYRWLAVSYNGADEYSSLLSME